MYDYVIVGGGSAGCVLAARLSEDPSVSVCLVEAGSRDTDENIHLPVGFTSLFRTRLDWDYDSHVEPHLGGRRVYLPRGRVLGGCSSLNAMVYTRGNRLDYAEWNQPGWSYEELLPYFMRSEDNERGASEYHAVGGPLAVSDGRARSAAPEAFVEAAEQAGFVRNDDFNGAEQDGFGPFQVHMRDGRRASTATAFLHPALERPNLTLVTNVQVHRVLVRDGRAVGVVGHRLDEMVRYDAAREVVLSAGAYNTPQLLMLSGIGPADDLAALGIDVVADLPGVGANLQDHPVVPLTFTHSAPVSLLAAGEPENVARYERERRGPLASNGPEVGGFVRTDPGLLAPDVEFMVSAAMFPDSGLTTPFAHAMSCGPVLLAPRSRGRVELASADPTAKPRIRHNYFAEEADMRTAVTALRIGLDIAARPAMRRYAEAVFRSFASTGDADLRDYVRASAHSIFHAAGTCAMGSVVDHMLRVRGVDGLRVADASVLPVVGRGHIHAVTVAVGEKAADMIADRVPPTPLRTMAAR